MSVDGGWLLRGQSLRPVFCFGYVLLSGVKLVQRLTAGFEVICY
jgi:hypothetical protein